MLLDYNISLHMLNAYYISFLRNNVIVAHEIKFILHVYFYK